MTETAGNLRQLPTEPGHKVPFPKPWPKPTSIFEDSKRKSLIDGHRPGDGLLAQLDMLSGLLDAAIDLMSEAKKTKGFKKSVFGPMPIDIQLTQSIYHFLAHYRPGLHLHRSRFIPAIEISRGIDRHYDSYLQPSAATNGLAEIPSRNMRTALICYRAAQRDFESHSPY